MPRDRSNRPTRTDGRLITGLLITGRTDPDGWQRDERAAVTRLHQWAHGTPLTLGSRPRPVGQVTVAPTVVNVEQAAEGVAEALAWETRRRPDAQAFVDLDLTAARGGVRYGAELLDLGEAGGTEALDEQVARLAGFIVEAVPGEPSRSEGAIDTALRLLREVYADGGMRDRMTHAETSLSRTRREWEDRARQGREQADRLIADAAEARARAMTAEGEVRGLREQRDLTRTHADALDAARAEANRRADELFAETERLRGQLGSVIAERDRVRDARVEVEDERDDAREQVVTLGRQLDEAQAALVELRPSSDVPAHEVGEAQIEVVAHLGSHPPRELYVAAAGYVRCEGPTLSVRYLAPSDGVVGSELYDDGKGRPLTEADLPAPCPLDLDPRRPHLDRYPSDAVTLTYPEVRRLLALHIEQVAESVTPVDASRVDGLAAAMRDGETPLRLAEVLDR